MPAFLAAILANVLGNVAATPASDKLRALFANGTRRLGADRSPARMAPQVPPARTSLGAAPSPAAPPVPLPPASASSIAARLAGRR